MTFSVFPVTSAGRFDVVVDGPISTTDLSHAETRTGAPRLPL
ncbi:hypothetical protein ACIO14_19000 [Nocardia fluminea]